MMRLHGINRQSDRLPGEILSGLTTNLPNERND
jgi:hypothetical protein